MHPHDNPAPGPSPGPISGFAATHCMICEAGWTRRSADGGVVVICLLDREKVWPQMIACDRYEPRLPEPDEDYSAPPAIRRAG